MDVLIMDRDFNAITQIDNYESLIWTERYSKAGDFELYIPGSSSLLKNVKQNYYAWIKGCEQVMIIEQISIKGGMMTFSGRSLESILDRRIIWTQTILNSKLQYAINRLLKENVISPSINDRKIPGFIFEESTDPAIVDLELRVQYTGDNLYESIISICESLGLGFSVRLTDDGKFVFKLYSGKDRTDAQEINPHVTFSPDFDNLISSNYVESDKAFKNVTLVAGEDEGSSRRMLIVGSAKGLDRRELYTDARDIQSETEDGNLPDDEYNAQLEQRGKEKLSECEATKLFEGEAEPYLNFQYGIDYFKGDIVQISNEYGINGRARITEYIRSYDTSGFKAYPTFTMI